MTFKEFSQPANLEKYSFLWSEARLVIASIALFKGGIPVLWILLPGMGTARLVQSLLTIMWIISGAAAVYLLYRWNGSKQMLFGKKDAKDTVAFFVSVVSGINLGIVGLAGRNIGMSLAPSYPLWVLAGLVYLAAAAYLYKRWTESGKKLF